MKIVRPTPEEYRALREIARSKVWPAWREKAGADAEAALGEVIAAVGD